MSVLDPVPPTIICPACKHPNPYWFNVCEQCNSPLPKFYPPVMQPPPAVSQSRPGCLTAYVLVMGFFGLLVGLVMALAVLGAGIDGDAIALFLGGLILGIGAGWWLYGLWQGKNWARIAAIVIHVLLLIFTVIGMATGDSEPSASSTADMTVEDRQNYEAGYSFGYNCAGVGLLIVNTFALYWFSKRWPDQKRKRQPTPPPYFPPTAYPPQ